MPSVSNKQRKFMGMQLGKKRRGQKTDVDMTEEQLMEYATGPVKMKRKKRLQGRKK